jgi:hypothetical protein
MGDFPRKADGRRVFSTALKRSTAQPVLSGENKLRGVALNDSMALRQRPAVHGHGPVRSTRSLHRAHVTHQAG